MLKSFNSRTKLCNYVCALLTLFLVILQFTPFWHYGSGSISVNGYVWLEPNNTEIAGWISSQLGYAPTTNSIAITSILVLVLGVAGIVLCIMKSGNGLMALLPAASALSGLYAFAFKPVFRLGSTMIIQLILCIAILAVAVMAIVFSFKKKNQEATGKKAMNQGDIDVRITTIRALGDQNKTKSKKNKVDDSDSNFYKLLNFLSDEAPECRIAAAEELGKTSRDVAFTHISHILSTEKDENVIKALRAALTSIRENMEHDHAAKA